MANRKKSCDAATNAGRSQSGTSTPPRPLIAPFTGLPTIPAMETLMLLEQWVSWDYIWMPGKGKWDKPPINPATGHCASSSNPNTWASYSAAARHTLQRGLAGVGFVLSADDGLTGIDLDDCRDPETGRLDDWAEKIVGLAETYGEVSPSGRGLRLFALRKVERATKNDAAHVEIYATGRYLTITGNHLPYTPDEIRSAPLTVAALLARAEEFKARGESARQEGTTVYPPGQGARAARPSQHGHSQYFKNVNSAALQNLADWVPALFGLAAIYQPGTRGYRISSRALGRGLDEDLSITPMGAKDWGVHDMGDPRGGARSPIDLVIAFGPARDAKDAAKWLCKCLMRTPEFYGWTAADEANPFKRAPEAATTHVEDRAINPTTTLTQDELARIFADRYGGRLRYCHSTGAWFEWTGLHWGQDTKARAFDFVRRLGREMTEGSSPREMREVRKVTFAAGVKRFAQGDQAFAVSASDWDRDGYLLGTPGGTVDLRTGILRQSDPREGIRKLTSVAPADRADCTRWLQFLDETTGGDAGLIRFLQQWGGYCLTGDTREHALFFGYGPGGNGKSVFVNAYTGILADYAVTAAMDTFTASRGDKHPTELAMLRGARLATASETEEGKSWAEARIKSITGGDAVSARFMRQDFFTFMPAFKLLIVGNHKPVLRNVDDAARRRFNIVPFTRRPVTPDRDLEGKLRAEWPGILRWLIEGCLDWQANGLVRPESVTAATESYFSDMDLFGQWLEEECDLEPGNTHQWATTAELFGSWAEYAKAAGEQAGSQKALKDMLVRRGVEPYRSKTARGLKGIRLRSSESDREVF